MYVCMYVWGIRVPDLSIFPLDNIFCPKKQAFKGRPISETIMELNVNKLHCFTGIEIYVQSFLMES